MAKVLSYGDETRLIQWASDISGATYNNDARAIGVVDAERIRGVAIFDTFSAANCHIHFASDGSKRWLTREALVAFFAYPFVQCKLRRVTGWVPSNNLAAQKFGVDLGFSVEGRLRNWLPDDDIVIYGMTRDHCAFIPPEYRKA